MSCSLCEPMGYIEYCEDSKHSSKGFYTEILLKLFKCHCLKERSYQYRLRRSCNTVLSSIRHVSNHVTYAITDYSTSSL